MNEHRKVVVDYLIKLANNQGNLTLNPSSPEDYKEIEELLNSIVADLYIPEVFRDTKVEVANIKTLGVYFFIIGVINARI